MPWCPECGAEYVEGIAECRKCGVSLAAVPPPPPPSAAARLAPLLSRVRALTYAREAYRLLRRRPGLLLLPVAIAVFNAVESGAGSYLATTQTRFGRGVAEMAKEEQQVGDYARIRLLKELVPENVAAKSFKLASDTFGGPIPYPKLEGLQTYLWWATRPGDPEQYFEPTSRVQALQHLLLAAMGLLLGALFLSGYYGLLRESVAESDAAPSFWRHVNRWYPRFVLFVGLVYLITHALSLPMLLLGESSGSAMLLLGLVMDLEPWLPQVLVVLLALTLIAVAVEDATLGAALKRGLRTVWRGWATTLLLLVALAVVCGALWTAAVGLTLAMSALTGAPLGQTFGLAYLGVGAVYQAALAALGLWLCLAQFLWYRDANPVPVPVTEAVEEAPPVSEGE